MKFQFDSFQQMLEMAGHGPYVWTAVLVSLVVMAWLLVRPLQLHRANLKSIARQLRREQRRRGAGEEKQ